jgi:hypothetical protein
MSDEVRRQRATDTHENALTPAPRSPIGSPAWQREVEAVDAKREAATVYQIAFWQDDKRAIPTDFVACALFAGIQGKDAAYVEQEPIASANGLTITFTGRRLTQVHADVWEGIMHLARQFPQGSVVRFRARQLLRLIGRHTGKRQRDELKLWLDQLTATAVVIHDEKNKSRFRGSLLPKSAERDEDGDTMFAVDVSRDLAKVFASGFSVVDWQQRQRLQKKPLALWLQHYFSRFPKPVTVSELLRLSGSTSRTLFHFRAQMKAALAELAAEGVIGAWRIDESTDAVHVTRPGKTLPAPAGAPALPPPPPINSAQGELPLLQRLPVVSERAKATFRELYPSRDADRCLADFAAWLSNSGKSAEKPDLAFLGFAKKWASGS